MGKDTEILGPTKGFEKTSWSLVRSVRGGKGWDPLIRLYWKPLYFYVRRRGFDNETSKDLIQEFLTTLIERRAIEKADPSRGRFRTFLLTSLDHFLADWRKKETRQKRGGGAPLLTIDFPGLERDYSLEVGTEETPERLACRAWAHELLDQCLIELEGDPAQVAALRMRLKGADYTQICQHTRLSESVAHLAVHRLGREFGEILGRHLRELCPDPREFQNELTEFLDLLG